MKRIEVNERAFGQFEEYRGREDDSRALSRLIRLAEQRDADESEKIALVILEGHWFSLKENAGQASNAPFLEGVCRLVDNLKSYRLNFYDAGSFQHALDAVADIREKRIILYIGAHGSKCMIADANAKNLMKKVANFSSKRKIEGVLLSSCLAAGHDDSMFEAFKGKTNWLFGYQSSVDFLGSVQVEAALLEQASEMSADDVEDVDKVVAKFSKALNCFNPKWKIGSEPRVTLDQSIRLVMRGKHMKLPQDYTPALIKASW